MLHSQKMKEPIDGCTTKIVRWKMLLFFIRLIHHVEPSDILAYSYTYILHQFYLAKYANSVVHSCDDATL